MKWTQGELEKLYQDVNAKAVADAEFRQEMLKDAKAAIEKFAGRPLPEGFSLKIIEKDSSYASTYVVPNFAQGEIDLNELDMKELGDEQLASVPSGLSIALIVSICGAAASVGGCGADACGANVCGGNACAANACGADACAGNACGGNADAAGTCAGAACGGDVCGTNAGCAGYASGVDECGLYTDCVGYATA